MGDFSKPSYLNSVLTLAIIFLLCLMLGFNWPSFIGFAIVCPTLGCIHLAARYDKSRELYFLTGVLTGWLGFIILFCLTSPSETSAESRYRRTDTSPDRSAPSN